MTYLVATGHSDGRAHHWWASFLVYGWEEECIQDSLDRHNSKARINPSGYQIGDLIEFETEQDFTAFVLRWS